ncbi:AAA family ATPase [Mycoplasmatota bacterium zrk1]
MVRGERGMIRKIKIKGFKGFNKETELDLTKTKNYSWNTNHIKDGIVKNCLLYGKSGSGKTNFGEVLIDIQKSFLNMERKKESGYVNKNGVHKYAEVNIEYSFYDDGILTYHYKKTDENAFIFEELILDTKTIFIRDVENEKYNVYVEGFDTINLSNVKNSQSFIVFLFNNSNYSNDNQYYSDYHPIGYVYFSIIFGYPTLPSPSTLRSIKLMERDKVDYIEVNKNLKKTFNEIGYSEYPIYDAENKDFILKLSSNKNLKFQESASSGQKVLLYILIIFVINPFLFDRKDQEKFGLEYEFFGRKYKCDRSFATLFFFDEFDAFYDIDLSLKVLKLIERSLYQTIVTTHNTNLISNKISRPDCYYIITKNEIKNISSIESREIRIGNSLEKMFINGDFLGLDE